MIRSWRRLQELHREEISFEGYWKAGSLEFIGLTSRHGAKFFSWRGRLART